MGPRAELPWRKAAMAPVWNPGRSPSSEALGPRARLNTASTPWGIGLASGRGKSERLGSRTTPNGTASWVQTVRFITSMRG